MRRRETKTDSAHPPVYSGKHVQNGNFERDFTVHKMTYNRRNRRYDYAFCLIA